MLVQIRNFCNKNKEFDKLSSFIQILYLDLSLHILNIIISKITQIYLNNKYLLLFSKFLNLNIP